MAPRHESVRPPGAQAADAVRDPRAVPQAVLAARQRPMSERLELALSWNAVAAELRAGVTAVTQEKAAERRQDR